MANNPTAGWDIGGNSQRLSGWQPSSLPNDRLIHAGRENARARSRELRRNSGWGERAVSALVAHLVGTGIQLRIQAVPKRPGGRASAQARALAARTQALWDEWAADPQECDVYGDLSWHAMQSVLVGCLVEHGEVLLRRRQSNRNSTVDLRLQGIEPDWIASHLPENEDTVDGVRYWRTGPDAGRVRSFHLHLGNPHDPLAPVLGMGSGSSWATEEVPAGDVVLAKRVTSPGQRRGIPWLASVAVSLHDLSLFRDATLKRQQIAAMLAMFVTDNATGAPGVGGVNRSPLFARGSDGVAQLESATVVRLGRGEGIHTPQLPQVQGQSEWARFVLQEIASGLGLSYEAFTGDLTGVNFSSARMGALQMQRQMDMLREAAVRSQILLPVWRWWRLSAQAVLGAIPPTIHAVWAPPRAHQVDPVKETAAKIQRLKHGLASLNELIAEDGRNPEEVLAGVAETAVAVRELGLQIPDVPTMQAARMQGSSPETDDDESTAERPGV